MFVLENSVSEYPVEVGVDASVDTRSARFAATDTPRDDADGYPTTVAQLVHQRSTRIKL